MNDFIDKFNSFPLGQKVLFLVLIMVGIFIGFWMGIHKPMEEEIQQADQEIVRLQQEKARLEQLRRNREQVVQRLEDLQRQLLVAREKLPANAEIPSLLQRIHNQGKTAGLEINKFKRNSDIVREHFIEIPVEMELVGTYDELANFFFYIGRMTRIVDVSDVTLTRRAKGLSPEGILVVTASARTFRLKSQ
ncbi:MAG: type 4a pilus biogenesis protein PilO [Bradymonadaceae bacterium]|nr:type 4a pilus biogenesis protein PilO [Lujinxingiaceae bacterium]